MCVIEAEVAPVWRDEWRRARKPHRCGSCGTRILPGSRYAWHFSVFDGHVSRGAVCEPCQDARAEFAASHQVIPPHDDLGSVLNECIEHTRHEPRWYSPAPLAKRRTDVAARDAEDVRWRLLLAQLKRRQRAARRARASP